MPGMCYKRNGLALQGFPEKAMNKLEDFGFIQSRPKGEYHANNQQMSKLLHKAIGLGNKGAAPQVIAHAHSLCRPELSLSSAAQYHPSPGHLACRPCRQAVLTQWAVRQCPVCQMCEQVDAEAPVLTMRGLVLAYACRRQMC